ncbi:MAG: ChbG/HpnK family deacetylase [Candidatus Electryonea clarkiae]|nr:ChbG/HpnK family deacetylase [Candidatus Electryonea clarkiae]MDP8288184.1 ChbG/HpnK family deacetylase [Candidatus Electryonea clarkiae]
MRNRYVKIIINADDLGGSIAVNRAIFHAISKKRITSATMMANGDAFEDAVENAVKIPDCSFGIHLNISSNAPVSNHPGLEPLIGSNGKMKNIIWNSSIDSDLKNAIYFEWCAQIEKIRTAGIKISHIDSHHHVHTIPKLFPVLKAVQKDKQIRKVRLTKNLYSNREKVICLKKLLKHIWNFGLKNYYLTRTTDCFTEFVTFPEIAKENKVRFGKVELMIHLSESPSDEFIAENDSVKMDWISNLPFEVMLINYNDL